jgi:endonuclease G
MSRHIRIAALAAALPICMLAAAPACAQNHPENNKDFCKTIWDDIGVPEAASGDGITTIVCHKGYIVGHNDSHKTPNWVIERLTPTLTGKGASREGKDFAADALLPDKARGTPQDYDPHNSEFDKGHNAPAADFGGNQDALNDTFFYSNAVPQIGMGFNRSIWRSLETQVRNLVGKNHPLLYVITGPIYQEAAPIKIKNGPCPTQLTLPTVKPVTICADNAHGNAACAAGVAVPAAMYKIVYNPMMQNAFAVVMENKSHTGLYAKGRGGKYIQAHRVGIETVEELTGLTFFPNLPERKRRQIRLSCVDVATH